MSRIVLQFIKFSFIGVINTALDFSIYFILNHRLNVHFLVANAFAFICAATFSYFANKNLTFNIKGGVNLKQYLIYVLFGLLTLIIVEGVMYLGVSKFGLDDLLTKVLATAISVILNFVFSKWLVFERK